jgi:hypothetical protein
MPPPIPLLELDSVLRFVVGITLLASAACSENSVQGDESLATVPDFELLTRLALRFGPHRIIFQLGMTATARADDSTTTYRPDAYRQIARDKTLIIDQLLVPGGVSRWFGRLAQDFAHYLQRDVLSDMHLAFARHIFGIGGDCPEFRQQIVAARGGQPAAEDSAVRTTRLGDEAYYSGGGVQLWRNGG